MALNQVYIVIKANTKQAQRETENLDAAARDAIRTYQLVENQIDKMADNAVQDFRRISNAGKKSSKSVRAAFDPTAMLGAIGLGSVAGSFLKDSIAQFGKIERFKTVLTTTFADAVDPAKEAGAAMSDIRKFAASTPFAVGELTDSYIKLANRGMRPTMEEMTRFGDIASSQGKGFNQFTEAVLDATTGEFERLKEFGIKGSKAGSQVTLSFKGVMKQVQNTPEAIKQALLEFGKMKGVAGGMDAVSKTLEGRLSNLGDTIDYLKFKTGEFINIGLGPLLEFFTDGEKGIARVQTALIFLGSFVLPLVAYAGWTAISPFLPFIGIAAGVAAALTAIYLVIEDFFTFAQGGDSMFADFLSFLGFDKSDIETFQGFLNTFFGWIGSAWNATVNFFKKNTWIMKTALAVLFWPITAGILLIKGFIWLWKNLPGIIMEAIDAIIGQMGLLWDALVETFLSLGKKLIFMLFPIDALISVFNFIKPYILSFVNWVWEKLKPIREAFQAVKGFFVGGENPAQIQARAHGGPISAGNPYLVGEQGPEVIVPGQSGTVLPNSALGKAGGTTITNTISIATLNLSGEPDEAARDRFIDLLNERSSDLANALGLPVEAPA